MESIEKKIVQFFAGNKEIVSVHLFGSQAKGTAIEKSDVDCAVLFQDRSIPETLMLIQMREFLEEALGKDVDLVCLNTASPIICMQIYKHGKTLFKNDLKQYSRYIMKLFTDYFDLKLMRKPFEDNILKRKYYG